MSKTTALETMDRREFLKGVAMSAVASSAGAGCVSQVADCAGAPMRNFRCAPMKNGIRVGIVGTGARGYEAFAAATLEADNPLRNERFAMADMNVTTIRTKRSARNRSQAMDIPDFTRGVWKTPCNCNLM